MTSIAALSLSSAMTLPGAPTAILAEGAVAGLTSFPTLFIASPVDPRQAIAIPGKPLPQVVPTGEAALAWLAATMPAPAPITITAPLSAPSPGTGQVVSYVGSAPVAPGLPLPPAETTAPSLPRPVVASPIAPLPATEIPGEEGPAIVPGTSGDGVAALPTLPAPTAESPVGKPTDPQDTPIRARRVARDELRAAMQAAALPASAVSAAPAGTIDPQPTTRDRPADVLDVPLAATGVPPVLGPQTMPGLVAIEPTTPVASPTRSRAPESDAIASVAASGAGPSIDIAAPFGAVATRPTATLQRPAAASLPDATPHSISIAASPVETAPLPTAPARSDVAAVPLVVPSPAAVLPVVAAVRAEPVAAPAAAAAPVLAPAAIVSPGFLTSDVPVAPLPTVIDPARVGIVSPTVGAPAVKRTEKAPALLGNARSAIAPAPAVAASPSIAVTDVMPAVVPVSAIATPAAVASSVIGAPALPAPALAPEGKAASPVRTETAVRAATPRAAMPDLPRTEVAAAPRVDTAARTFADAIHRAVTIEAPVVPVATAAATPVVTEVASTPQAPAGGPLDVRQAQWPARMIERIEAFRDSADANWGAAGWVGKDMSIRLIPDALGTIDVSLKRDGDSVQVQLTAEQPQTRQLLAEAAPKLAELAEARGVRLQPTTADPGGSNAAGTGATGNGTPGNRPQHQSQQQSSAPPAFRRNATRPTDNGDDRVA